MKIIRTTLLILLIVLGAVFGLFWKRFHFILLSETSAFSQKVKASNREVLDLTAFGAFQWDELTFLGPYQNICSLNIKGFSEGLDCWSSHDDGECYLIFLKDNRLVGQTKIARKDVDFATSKIPWRICRAQAIFSFTTKENWPKLELKK